MAQNLIPKDQRNRAQNTLNELIKLIGEELDYPATLVLIRSGSEQSLVDTSNALHEGRLHLAALNGLEYGWLKQQSRGRVKTLVSSHQETQVVQYEQLMVRKEITDIGQLQGASVVIYKDPSPSLAIYLRQLEKEFGPGFLNNHLVPVENGSRALQAVVREKADATIVDLYTLLRYRHVFPGQENKLRRLKRSAAFPLAPVVGEEQVVNQLRPNLWRDVQRVMTQIHRNPDARAFLDVWRVRSFKAPTKEFEGQADEAAKQFPLNELQAARRR